MSLDDISCVSAVASEPLYSLRSSSSSLDAEPSLDPWVCRWERNDLEKNLQIYYQDDYMESPSDMFSNIKMDEMTNEQRDYFEKVNEYLLPIDGRIATMDRFKYYPEKFMTVLDQISNNLGKREPEEFVRLKVMKFLRVLTNLVGKISNHKQVYEGSFIKLLASFAEMCCLHPEISISKEDEAVWKNLHGINRVVSKPVIRLYKHGIMTKPEVRTSEMVVSVKVKKDFIKDPEELEMQLRLMESTHLSNSCSSLSSNESYDGSIPSIEIDLNKEVLGQHAGELLLDLYECHRSVDAPILTMPGMIVDGTKVYMTLFEISNNHFRKLEGNQELTPEDKATIYYSKPLNILQDDERSILMEIFIRLNNIEFYT
ncbi:uncharacterized protein LOC127724127 [Mytilus californianus]|uniref:uncharacterized protein LOC127724127 n=1 Tax=Mytilus californianus TaxID=6549 RepID=UPI0022477490|nr:uncharacterized protein LOC127724127 [Mytilus californianus]